MAILASIIYAVSVNKSNGVPQTGPLNYGTVEKEEIGGTIGYCITSRSGAKLNVDADAIDCLIAALIKARGTIDPVTGNPATFR